MSDDDLVKQLQELAVKSNDGDLRGPALAAADRIEGLIAQRNAAYEAGVRAGLEAAAVACPPNEGIGDVIRDIDPAKITERVKGQDNE